MAISVLRACSVLCKLEDGSKVVMLLRRWHKSRLGYLNPTNKTVSRTLSRTKSKIENG